MEISDELLSGLLNDDASQLELALKYTSPTNTATKTKPIQKEHIQEKTRKTCLISESQERFSCVKCKKLFPTKQRLSKHLRNAHLPAKYQCQVCKKQYTRRDLLKDHENTHSEEPLFKCYRCDKLFRKNSCLKQHERKHEKDDQKNMVFVEDETHNTTQTVAIYKKGTQETNQVQNNGNPSADDNHQETNQVQNDGNPSADDNQLPSRTFCVTYIGVEGSTEIKVPEDLIFTTENTQDKIDSFENLTSIILEDDKSKKEAGPFICDRCKKFFPTHQRLKKHLRNAHLSGKFRCPVCDKLFTRRDLCKDHVYTHTNERRYKCNYKCCKKSFHMVISLRQHEKIHKRKRKASNFSYESDDNLSESEENRCCSRTACLEERKSNAVRSNSSSPYGLKEFIEEDAADMELALELETTENTVIEEQADGGEFICFHCFRKFASHDDMLLHIEDEHFTFICEMCNKQFPTDKRLKKHQRDAHISGKFRCPICDKQFKRRDLCKDHVYTHSEKPLFKCKYNDCGKTFRKPFSLKQHEKTHTNLNRRTCPICNESVVQLSKHLNRHLKTKQYPCGSCDKSFTRLKYLQEHEKIHLGEKGFVCNECHAEFKSTNVLYKHKRSKHAEENYVCELPDCGQEFNRKDNMITHMKRIHRIQVETVRAELNDDNEPDNTVSEHST